MFANLRASLIGDASGPQLRRSSCGNLCVPQTRSFGFLIVIGTANILLRAHLQGVPAPVHYQLGFDPQYILFSACCRSARS